MGQPIRGRIVPVAKPSVNLKASIHNRFDIEVIDAKTGEIKQRARGFNTICNQLWTRLANAETYNTYIHYGTGTGTPSSSDVRLFQYLGGSVSTADGSDYSIPDGVYSVRRKIVLNSLTANGSTLTEVGIAYSSAQNALVTHAMLQDMNGNPISILKTDTDEINIYATVYVHFNRDGYSGIRLSAIDSSVANLMTTIAGTTALSSKGIVAPASPFLHQDDTGGNVPTTYNNCLDNEDSNGMTLTPAFDATTKKMTFTATRAGINSMNVGGIPCLVFASGSSGTARRSGIILMVGGDWYPYSSVYSEAIGTGDGVSTDFMTNFALPHSAAFYVDGVTASARVDYAPPTTDLTRYIRVLSSWSTDNNLVPGLAQYKASSNYTVTIYNPCYAVGIGGISNVAGGTSVQASNDLEVWETVISSVSGSGAKTVNIPTGYKNYKYFKFDRYGHTPPQITAASDYTGANVHFDVAPASGAVITADYKCDVIAKDENHVFDFSLEIQLGEYTEV